MKYSKKMKSILKSKDRMWYAYDHDETLTKEERRMIMDMLIFDYKINNFFSSLSTAIPAFFLVLGFVLVFILKV